VAVIYPPVREVVLQSVRCHSSQLSQKGSLLSSSQTEVLLPPEKFNVLVVGRIVKAKCPGLIIRALGWLHRALTSAQNMAVESEVSSGGTAKATQLGGEWATEEQLSRLFKLADAWSNGLDAGILEVFS
jgi:hypothetical protein